MHFFTNPSSLDPQSTGGYGFGPINTATSGPPELTKKFDISATFKMAADDKLYACQDSMMVVQPYRKADNSIHPGLVNVILQPLSGLAIPFSAIRYYVIRGVRKDSFIAGANIVNVPATNTDFITNFWLNWNQYKIDTAQPSLLDPGVNALGFEDATPALDNRPLAKIFNNSYSPLSAVKVSEGQWIANLKEQDIISFEVITSNETLDLDIEYLRKHKYEIDVTALMAMPVNVNNSYKLRAKREIILSFIDPAALFGMHYFSVVTLGDAKIPKTGGQIYTDILDKFSTKSRIYIDIRSEKGYSYNFYLAYNDGSGNRMKIKFGGTSTYIDTPYSTNEWPIFYTDTTIGTNVNSIMDIQLRKDDNSHPLLLIENGKLQAETTRILVDFSTLFPTSRDWSNDILLQVPNYDNGSGKENISHHILLNYFRLTNYSTIPEVIKNQNEWNSSFGALDTSIDPTALAFNHVRNEKKFFSRVIGGGHITESGVFLDTSNALLYSEKRYTYHPTGRTYPTVDFTRVNSNRVMENKLFPKDMTFNKWQITLGGSSIDILEISGANTGSVYTDIGDIYLLGLTRVELALLQNAPGLSPLHQKYISFDANHGVDDNGVPFKKYDLKVVGLNSDGKEHTVSPNTSVTVYGSGGTMLCSESFAGSAAIPNLLRDPANLIEWGHFGKWSYDGNDPEVQAVYASDGDVDGIVKINDLNIVNLKRKVDLKGEAYFPADASGSLSTVKANYPLIVIVHGNGHRYTNYQDFAAFLALNGFIVASVNCLIYTGKRRYKLIATSNPTWDYKFSGADGYTYAYNSTDQKLMILTEDIHTGVLTPTILNDWMINIDFEIKTGSGGIPKRIKFIKKTGTGGMASLGRANLVPLHLKILKAKFTSNIEDNIGLIGHSRGGEAVVRAAKDVNPTVAHAKLSQIKAVMSLAPTDVWDKENLTQDIPYYVLYGSKDGDVSGISANGIRYIPSSSPTGGGEFMGSGAFSLYDRANNTNSKSMTFVYGATHNGFIDDNNDYKDTSAILEEVSTQKMICRGYANAFFRRHLLGQTEWDKLLQGHYIPPSIPSNKIYQQYQDMSASTIVVDNFEGTINPTSWKTNSLGLPVTYSGSTPKDGVFRAGPDGIDLFSPHDTQGLKVESSGGTKELKFVVSASGLNVQALAYFSFRICHTVKLGHDYSSLDTLLIRLKDSHGNVKELTINQNVPYPDLRVDVPVKNRNDEIIWRDFKKLTKSALMTIRIPLVDFVPGGVPGNVDLIQIEEVTFILPSTFSGSVDMDSIEFTN